MLDFFLEDNFLIIKTKMESHTIEIKTCQIIVVTVNIFFLLKVVLLRALSTSSLMIF